MSDQYLKRGVSASKEDVHNAISDLGHGLYPRMFCKVYKDYLGGDDSYVNLMSSDGSGTKSILAYMYWMETGDVSIFEGIGQDALVMNLDDMMCVGARGPFLFSSLINRNKHRIPGEVVKAIIHGTQNYIEKLNQLGVKIIYTGGETADVGDLVRTISVDASMASRMPKKDLIYTHQIEPNMLIVGLSSGGQIKYQSTENSGIGSNGLTSARHDLLHSQYKDLYPETIESLVDPDLQYIGKHRLSDLMPNGQTLGQWLLSPTISYAPVLKEIFDLDRSQIGSIVHCTGGGAAKVLHFAQNVKIVKDNWLKVPPIFELIQKESNTSWQEMYQVFNMGIRLELYVRNYDIANQIINIAQSFGFEAQVIGYTESHDRAEVNVKHLNQNYIYH